MAEPTTERSAQRFRDLPAPHLRDGLGTRGIMFAVVVALLPAALGSFYFFGPRALALVAVASASAVVAEAACQAVARRRVAATDGSALVAGMLLAFTLPPGVPYWMAVVGAVFAVVVVKALFGGLGYNLLNPALAARAFLMAFWPAQMSAAWIAPARGTLSGISGVDAIATATPLGALKMARGVLSDPSASLQEVASAAKNLEYLYSSGSLKNLAFGNVGGCLGETSALLLAVGGVYLIARRIVSWTVPVSFIATVGLVTWMLGGEGVFQGNPLFHILSGGLLLGAFFMATDTVTSPITWKGRLIFGFGCGALTSIIRLMGVFPEGVCYSILLMNLTVPVLDRLTRPRILGDLR
ncbi:MAG: RnfABCDGE type electron transport complex subunit D [bacterium]